MARRKKSASNIDEQVSISAMRLEIGRIIDSFGFAWYDGITESVAREHTSEVTKAIESKYGKYFTVVEEISPADGKPPFHSSWHIIEKSK